MSYIDCGMRSIQAWISTLLEIKLGLLVRRGAVLFFKVRRGIVLVRHAIF